MRMSAVWLPKLFELDASYPKRVNILVDRFDASFVPEGEIRIVVLWEPHGRFISKVMEYPDFYDYVFTYHKFVLDNNPKARFFLATTIFVDINRKNEKRFSVSTVVGHKTATAYQGYKMRHELWFKRERITIPTEFYLSGGWRWTKPTIPTIYGEIQTEGERRLGDIKDIVFDSMFHIAIENVHTENYHTEKLVDCFLKRSVPIYMRAKNIGDFFNADGIIQVDNVEQAIEACNSLTEKDYYSRVDAMEDNYNRSLKYIDSNKMLTDRVLEVLE